VSSFRAPNLLDLNQVSLSSQHVVTDRSWTEEKQNLNQEDEDEFGDFNEW
jgi:hypothetical protein